MTDLSQHRLLTTPIELIKIQQQKHQQLLHTTRTSPTSTSTSASTSARAVALHIYRTGGIRALCRGLTATTWRDVGGFGLYFYGVGTSFPTTSQISKKKAPCKTNLQQYEGTLRLFAAPTPVTVPVVHHPDSVVDNTDTETDMLPHRPRPRPWVPLVAGAVAGIMGWIATFPSDVLKTRLQAGTITGADADTDTGLGSSWRTARKMYAESGIRVFWRGLVPTLVRAVPVNMAVFGTFEGVIWAFSRT